MLTETLENKKKLSYEEIKEIVSRAVDEALIILKEIDPDIHRMKYEKADETWVVKDRLIMGMMLELMFMGLFNYQL